MSKTFLTIDGIWLEDIESDGYKVYEKTLDVELRMVSGRMVREERGKVWVIEVSFSAIDPDTLTRLDTVIRSRKTHNIAFLPANGQTEVRTGEFLLTSLPTPALFSWLSDLPEWSGYSLIFEEVKPHA